MRLGIRRKLIGTLMLVGLLPLALSLVVILGGGATMRLHSIRNAYEHKAADSSNQIAAILTNELEKLELIAQLPQARNLAQEQTAAHTLRRGLPVNAPPLIYHPGKPLPLPETDDFCRDQNKLWPSLKIRDDPLRSLLNNPLAERLRVLAGLDGHNRQLFATDAFGELIACDSKPANYFQGGDDWWILCFAAGKGRAYISSVEINPATGTPVVSVAVPMYEENGQRLVGILKDKIDIAWLRQPLKDVTAQLDGAIGILFDEHQGRAILRPDDADLTRAAEAEYLKRGPNHQLSLLGALLGEQIQGSAPVALERRLAPLMVGVESPRWVVIVSKPAQAAMIPVFKLAATVAAIGIALILVLFIVGVAIANREIILPILRLREATAAVARGELNVRLISAEESDPTFRGDELGELAQDFDNMTRELQKSVGQLHRGAESRQRFMELAGHELRTPVTYIIGVCQLAQRQLQGSMNAPPSADATANAPSIPDAIGDPAIGSGGGGIGGTGGAGSAGRIGALTVSSLSKISAKAQRLGRIIENLLKLVNNEQFTTKLNKQPVDLRVVIQQVCNDNRPFVNERKQVLVCDLADNIPLIEGDHDKLEDALTNLLSNAIRFSPDGATIRVSAHPVVGDMLEILVEDAGPGISTGEAANLFEPFSTGDIMHHHSGTIEYGSKGIGLGLAIVRRFVEIHGGVVRAHPISGGPDGKPRGTQFQILLPMPATTVQPVA